MIIHIEGFNQNNEYFFKTISPDNQMICDFPEYTLYEWYEDGIRLDNKYNNWKDNMTYVLIYNHLLIRVFLKNKYCIQQSPYIKQTLTIKQIKDILSIKDNIYFNNVKLKDNKTFEYYNIKNNDLLFCNIHNDVQAVALTVADV